MQFSAWQFYNENRITLQQKASVVLQKSIPLKSLNGRLSSSMS